MKVVGLIELCPAICPTPTQRSRPLSKSSNTVFGIRRSPRVDRLLITLPFYILFIAQLIHHKIWRDEINAWAISYLSHNIPELLYRVHYEGHPALWYIILFAASHFSHAIWMLKLVTGIIGSGIYFHLAWRTPLRRLELLLVLLSYYMLFEYTILLRMYGLALLFALAYAYGRTRYPERILRNTLWLGLMANVDITAAILAVGLLLEYVLNRLAQPEKSTTVKLREITCGLAVYFACLAVSIETLWPTKDIAWTTGKLFEHFGESGQLAQATLKWVSIPWLPKPINILNSWEFTEFWPYYIFAPVIIIILYAIFRDYWRQGVIVATTILLGILFSQITSVAGVRHTGMVYIAFLIALWILRFQNARVSPLSYVLLFCTVVPGIISVIDQWSWPYADDEAAAAWIRQEHLESLPLFGTPDTNIIGVPELLHRPIYQLDCNCKDWVMTFSARRNITQRGPDNRLIDIPARLIQGFHTLNVTDGLFLNSIPLTFDQRKQIEDGGLRVQFVGEFDRGFVGDEYYFIYRIRAPLQH